MSIAVQSQVKDILYPVKTPSGAIDPQQFLLHFYQAIDWCALLESGFKHPVFPDRPLKLLPWQKRAIHTIQYSPKSGFICVAPRGYTKTTTFQLAMAAAAIAPPFPYFRLDIAYVSIGLEEALRALKVLKDMILDSKYAHLIKKKEEKRKITFNHNSSIIKAYPQSEGIRGLRAHYVVYDEWSRIREDLFAAIRPTLRNVGIKELGGSTPFGMAGDFWDQWEGTYYPVNEDPWDRLQIEDLVVFDKGKLILYKTEIPWMNKKQFIEDMRKLGGFDSPLAKQELMAAFLATGDTIVHPDWIRRSYDKRNLIPWVDHDFEELDGISLCGPICERHKLKKKHSIHLGFAEIPKVIAGDFGRQRDYAVFIIGCKMVVHGLPRIVILWIDRFRRMGDYVWIGDRAVNWMKRFNVRYGIFDGQGVGEGALDYINKRMKEEKIRASLWKTKTSDIDQPGEKTIKFRLGYVKSSYTKSKQDLVQEVVSTFNIDPSGYLIPFHEGQRELGMPKFNIWEMERECVNFKYEVQESAKTKRKSIIYGTQQYHDDIFMTLAYLTLALKFPHLGHYSSQYSVGRRKAKSTPPSQRKQTTKRSYAVGKKKKPRRRRY